MDHISKILKNASSQTIGVVGVDLAAIQYNFSCFEKKLSYAEITPVLKADAYGLGMKQVAQALIEAGAKSIVVATIDEGITLREMNNFVHIYVLHGVYNDTAEVYEKHNLTPILNTYHQVIKWNDYGIKTKKILDCLIHYDSGMSRTGMDHFDAEQFIAHKNNFKNINILYLMSHLSCSEDVENPLNAEQLVKFDKFCATFPDVKQSLTATPAVYMSEHFKKSMVRVGYGLYGFCSNPKIEYLKNVLHVYSRIIQVRHAKKGDTVGYSATHVMKSDGVLATLSMGYADGYHRFLHNYKPYVYVGKHKAFLVGRISMDFCVIDVSNIPKEEIYEGAWVQMIGNAIRVHDIVGKTEFIPHEIPIHMGRRYKWHYFS
jgi:alanine racemase